MLAYLQRFVGKTREGAFVRPDDEPCNMSNVDTFSPEAAYCVRTCNLIRAQSDNEIATIVANGESPGTRPHDAAMGRINSHPICKRFTFAAVVAAVAMGIARS